MLLFLFLALRLLEGDGRNVAVVKLNLRYRTEGRIRSKFSLITSRNPNPLGTESNAFDSCLPAREPPQKSEGDGGVFLCHPRCYLGRKFEGRNPQGLLHAEACIGGSQQPSESLFQMQFGITGYTKCFGSLESPCYTGYHKVVLARG